MNSKVTVSAIIANWNGADHLRICLPSLRSQSFNSLEIVVADNGSKDDSAEVVRENDARWLPLDKNMGLGPALNRGAATASGDFFLFINNDMRFHSEFVTALVEVLKQDQEVFATDGMQFNWDGTERAHLATRLVRRKPNGHSSTELVPGLHFYPEQKERPTPVYTGSAACLLVRRSLFEKLNGFDDRLPLGYEDVELCWRAWIHGWRTVYVPNAICWHRVSSSGHTQEGMRMNFRGILRGRLLLASKLLPVRYAAGTWLVSVAGLGKDVSRRRWSNARNRIETLLATAGLVPELLRERKSLFGNANTSPEKHLEFLLRLTDNARGI
jgi:GT2 family glycosyltransferase